jgi:hypothetical protein
MTDSSFASTKPSTSQRLRSFFKSPASKNYNKVLADSWEKSQADSPHSTATNKNRDDDEDDDDNLKKTIASTPLTQEEKVKALTKKRDAESPSGHFVLGHYRPLNATPGMEDFHTAKGLTDSVEKAMGRQ